MGRRAGQLPRNGEVALRDAFAQYALQDISPKVVSRQATRALTSGDGLTNPSVI